MRGCAVEMVGMRDENLGIEESGVSVENACRDVEYCRGLVLLSCFLISDARLLGAGYQMRQLVDGC
jgi:hypothetical protein